MPSTLPLLAITWDVSPAIFTIGTFELRWYAILLDVYKRQHLLITLSDDGGKEV